MKKRAHHKNRSRTPDNLFNHRGSTSNHAPDNLFRHRARSKVPDSLFPGLLIALVALIFLLFFNQITGSVIKIFNILFGN